jgi:hypothetical protein
MMFKSNHTACSILLSGCLFLALFSGGCGLAESTYNTLTNSETREITDRKPPTLKDDSLQDDRLEDKHPVFDPTLVDRRKLDDWEVNLSEAVTALDIPIVQPDIDPHLLSLWPSYADLRSQQQAHLPGFAILPSVNMLDGKAKQFDDGLFAALEQAYLLGNEPGLQSHESLIRSWLAEVPNESEAANFLKAGLKLLESPDNETLDLSNESEGVRKWLELFQRNLLASKPISFYTWNDNLRKSWRFGSYFQRNLSADSPEAVQLVDALKKSETLRTQYRNNLNFYAALSNPAMHNSVLSLLENGAAATTPITSVSINKLFRGGIPRDADLMLELVKRIRSGEVDLTPRPLDTSSPSGWYDYQVYALETLLVAEKGEEHNKLLLSKTYKQRMLDAFKALITKRRETHAKTLSKTTSAAAEPPKPKVLEPRLRVEPVPTYYLRTARSYQFLQLALLKFPGEDCLKQLKGLRKEGDRGVDLATELEEIKNRFYGLYLLSCEDIGLQPKLLDGEVDDESACYELAETWLKNIWDDTDFAADTRVAVPIATDGQRNVTRLWVTVGVRLTKLNARYATLPKIRVAGSQAEWQEPEGIRRTTVVYLIPVDEFVELEIGGMQGLTREELRAAIPPGKTREEVLTALKAKF